MGARLGRDFNGKKSSRAKTAAAGAGAAEAGSTQPERLTAQVRGQIEGLERKAEANAPSREELSQKAQTAAHAAGATGIAGFVMMLLEALACLAGGRAGTRVLKPHAMNAVRRHERVDSGVIAER